MQSLQGNMGEDTQLKLASFLTKFEEDINSRIEAAETLMALMLYRSMEERDRKHLTDEAKESDNRPSTNVIANKLEKLSWSIQGMSRREGVEALRRVPGGNIRGPAESYSYRPESEE